MASAAMKVSFSELFRDADSLPILWCGHAFFPTRYSLVRKAVARKWQFGVRHGGK